MRNAIPERTRRGIRFALIAMLAVGLLLFGFEVYGRWVARNMAVIAKAGVEAARAADWSSADAPTNSAVLLGGDTVAEVTGTVTLTGSADARTPGTGFLALLTDSAAGARIVRDTSQVAVLLQDSPIILGIRGKEAADTLPVARLWIVQLPGFIPVYSRGNSSLPLSPPVGSSP